MPLISVIIPVYNNAYFIAQALDSVLSQSITDIEVIVVDDGSTDESASIVQSYAVRDQRLKYIHQVNQGVAVSRNTGIKQSSGEFIAFIDGDDVWLPDHLKDLLHVMQGHEEIGLAHANITTISESGEILRTLKRPTELLSGNIFKPLLLRDIFVILSTVMIRRQCCDKVGLFDEALTRLGSEDRDLWLRITFEFKARYVDRIITHYRINSNGLSSNHENMVKGRLYVVEKLFRESKINQQLRRKAISRIHQDFADYSVAQKQFKKAFPSYIKAIQHDGAAVVALINIVKALVKP